MQTKIKLIELLKNKTLQKGLFIAFVILLFSPVFFSLNDPDYFWHYQAGQAISEQKVIPQTDPYSFSYPDFKWVNHEWLSDVIMYKIETISPIVLSTFYLFLFGLLIVFITWKRKLSITDMILLLLAFVPLKGYVGVREQVYSFLFFALFLILLKEKKYLYLPLIFLFWANLHGGFSLGIFLLVVFAGFEMLREIIQKNKVLDYKLYIFTALSVLATLINPYGLRIYEEVIRTVGDGYLTKHIYEWLPMTVIFNIRYALYLSLLIALFYFLKKKVSLEYLVIYLLLIVLSIKSVKYIPFAMILTFPLFLDLLEEFRNNYKFSKEQLFGLLKSSFSVGIVLIGFLYFNPDIFLTQTVSGGYPEKAIEVIRKEKDKNVFNKYGWGGYLIRYAPGNKYMIDGRMPSWRDKNNYPFKDYIEISDCQNIDKNLAKYHVDLFILPNEKPNGCDLIKELKNRNWREKYSDEVATILEK